ncbi:MAG: hypothetical protein M1393_06460 [Candidatus Thermoplasmatota archaeon]|nr:hypothetical protein [Candidatus Thermoplasmatota archaeon]MDA8143483.1 hypothetical protein [Thermoplasmatales archaeon]
MNSISFELMKTLNDEKHDIHRRGLKEFVISEYGIHDRLNAMELIESAKRGYRKRRRIFSKRVTRSIRPHDDMLCETTVCAKTCGNACSC